MSTTYPHKNYTRKATNGMMTDPQRDFVRSLYARVNALIEKANPAQQQAVVEAIEPVAPFIVAALSEAEVEIRDASKTIDTLKAVETLLAPVKQAEQAAEQKAKVAEYPGLDGFDRIISNKFGKACQRCGTYVNTGEGFAAQRGSWITICKPCASTDPIKAAIDAQIKLEKERAEQEALRVLRIELTGATKQLSHRIVGLTGSMTKDKAIRIVLPGAVVEVDNSEAAYAVSLDYTKPGVVRHTGGPGYLQVFPVGTERAIEIVALLLFMSDVELAEAQAAYGIHFHSCGRCNAPLSDDLSKARGLGPDCYSKVGF